MQPRTSAVPTMLGFTGSVLVLVGSLGVGWLGPSSAIRDWTLIASIRSSSASVALCAGLVVVGSITLIVAWLRLRGVALSGRPEALRIVLRCAVLWATPLLVSLPLFSRDVFAYVGQGRLMAAGVDPYSSGIATLPGWFGLGVDPMWADTPTPYGPLWLWIEQASVSIGGGQAPEMSIVFLRAVAVASLAATGYYALRIARLRGIDPAPTAWFVLASPLVLFTVVVGAHNDSTMLAFLLAGLFFSLSRRPFVALALVTAAIAVKPIAIVALPVIGIVWADQRLARSEHSGLRERLRAWGVSTLLSIAALLAAGIALGVGIGWVTAISSPTGTMHWYAPVTLPVVAAEGLSFLLGLEPGIAGGVIKALALTAAGVVVCALMLSRRRIDPVTRLTLALGAIVAASTAIHPWYILWLVTLATVGDVVRRHLAVYATIVFSCLSLGEALDIADPGLGGALRVLSTGLAAAAAVALVGDYTREEKVTVRTLGRALPTDGLARLRRRVRSSASETAR